jgi:hypothetical protein
MPEPDAENPASLPAKIRLTRPHGFIDQDGNDRFWRAGMVISAPGEVALLMDRGATHEVVE